MAYGPPQKINYTNLERLAAPEKLIILPSTKQEYESMSTLRKLRMAVCGKQLYSPSEIIAYLVFRFSFLRAEHHADSTTSGW